MSSTERIIEVIDAIYDVALDPARWTELLRAIGDLVGAPQGSLMLCSASKKTMTDFGYGRNEEALALFNTRFIGEDPWYEPIAMLGPGIVATGQELCPTKAFEHTAVYQECMKLDEVYDCLGLLLESGQDLNSLIAFQRPEFLPVFGQDEKRVFAILAPHLLRLVRLHRKFDSLSANATFHDALDSLMFGVLIVSASGGIQFVNRAAREMTAAEDGLRLTRGGLAADHDGTGGALKDAQRRALGGARQDGRGRRGSTILVHRRSGRRPYTVQIMPLGEQAMSSASLFGPPGLTAMIVITDPEKTPALGADLLARAYGLIPAEASLAGLIGAGLNLKDAAERLAITEQTARWHLKNVLAKAEVNRQSELIALLSRMTAPLRPQV